MTLMAQTVIEIGPQLKEMLVQGLTAIAFVCIVYFIFRDL